jgi:hypothetical protein
LKGQTGTEVLKGGRRMGEVGHTSSSELAAEATDIVRARDRTILLCK